jgi:putative component of membrane protein insertase Oxa1/YidC/SpoIIIJ protein YidD
VKWSRRRKLWTAVTVGLLAGVAVDAARPPARQIAARALLGGIHFYQDHLRDSGTKLGVRCRFEPSCSRFAEAVVAQQGAWVGGARAAWRIVRCGPWTKAGSHDPP